MPTSFHKPVSPSKKSTTDWSEGSRASERPVCGLLLFAILCTIVSATGIALFVFSIILLAPHASVGAGCPPDACANGGTPGCVWVFSRGESCASVCSSPDVVAVSPFRFGMPQFEQTGAMAYCPFPAYNENWRLPLSIISGLLCATSALAAVKRWKLVLAIHSLLTLCAGAVFLYVMGADSLAIKAGSAACADKFTAFSSNYYNDLEVDCNPSLFIAVAVLDAGMAVGLALISTLLWRRFRSE